MKKKAPERDSSSRPRIALVTHSLSNGGSPRSLLYLAKLFLEEGWQPIVYSEKEGELIKEFEALQIPLRIVHRDSFRWAGQAGLVKRFYQHFKKDKVQLIHLNTLSSYYKYAALAGRLGKKTVVWWIREEVQSKRCQRLLFWLRTLAHHVVGVSQEIIDNLPGVKNPYVIYNGVAITPSPQKIKTGPLRQRFNIPQESFVIGCVAAIEPRKGQADLLQALTQINNPPQRIDIIFLGPTTRNHLAYEENLKRIPLPSHICAHFAGSVQNSANFYAEFSVCVLPTLWEGCSRVLLEAMAAECPIITTLAGGNPELLENEISAWLVPPENPEVLALALKDCISSPETAQKYTDAARLRVEQNFSEKHHQDHVMNLYRKLCS